MTDLVEFLTARLDEDERKAERSGPHPVAWLTFCDADGQLQYTAVGSSADERGESGIWIVDGKEAPAPSFVHVIYNPARVLREVEAKRRIVDGFAVIDANPERLTNAALHLHWNVMQGVVVFLALPYADHPDYDESWRP